jgi:hypothetical protein
MTGGSEGWYIDSWDASAGRAFCSFRAGITARLRSHVEAYFVAPPFFEPEIVASRAPGLAASRGTFQLGFFITEREVAFNSLEEIIGLVRRVYSSRGMWPGPGGGLPPAPRPPDSPPDAGAGDLHIPIPPPFPGFAKQLEEFVRDDDKTKLCQLVQWRQQDEISEAEAHSLLVAAGTSLMGELIVRIPSDAPIDDIHGWQVVFADLCALCRRIGIEDDVFKWAVTRSSWPKHSRAMDFDRIRLGDNYPIDSLYKLLERLPLPTGTAREYAVGKGHDPSLLTLLSAHISYAGAAVKQQARLELALLVFTAVCVTTRNRSTSYRVSAGPIVSAAFAWYISQLPTLKFHPAIEKVIRAAPRDWYRFEITGLGPLNGPGSGPSSSSSPKPGPTRGPTGYRQRLPASRPSSTSNRETRDFNTDDGLISSAEDPDAKKLEF